MEYAHCFRYTMEAMSDGNPFVHTFLLISQACYVMAFETDDPTTPGGWNTMFATAPSPKGPWTVLDVSKYRMPLNVEHADPTIRYIQDDTTDSGNGSSSGSSSGTYYVMTGRASLSTPCSDSVGRYFMEIYRSRDLLHWEAAAGMGSPTLIHGMLTPNAPMDRRPASVAYSPKEHAYMEQHANTTVRELAS